MTSPTTFVGELLGVETCTFADGSQVSYTYKIVDGTIADDGTVSWFCDSAELDGKWRLEVAPAPDGMSMDGIMTAVSGRVVSGVGTYVRIVDAVPEP